MFSTFLTESNDPLIVVVKGGSYECYGDLTQPRMAYLFGFLQGMGGVNHTVVDGIYHFNLEQVALGNVVASLELAE